MYINTPARKVKGASTGQLAGSEMRSFCGHLECYKPRNVSENKERRTQVERRAATRRALLDAAFFVATSEDPEAARDEVWGAIERLFSGLMNHRSTA